MRDIAIKGLAKSYGDKQVLHNLCMTLPSGRVTCLMGPSGIGKTTLLRLLAGLEAPDGGTITGMDGARIGMVFQEDRLLDWLDPVENIRLTAPAINIEKAMEALRRFGLGECAGQAVSELSGGMRRRVALLRALLSPAEVLLMDEPFNGLDEATREAVIRETLRLINGRTALIVTHDPGEAKLLGAEVVTIGVTVDLKTYEIPRKDIEGG